MTEVRAQGSSSQLLSGIDLSRGFHHDVVRPLMLEQPGLLYAAGRLGSGSDVLGVDDDMSRDHDWGLRLTLLVRQEMVAPIRDMLERRLPSSYLGYSVRFAYSQHLAESHHIDVYSPDDFVSQHLGFNPCSESTTFDWLSVTGQAVLEVSGAPLFVDTLGEPTQIREQLAWYPEDVWRYVVACDWARIDEVLPLMSRAGSRDDELGAKLIASRIVEIAIHLAFLLHRRWIPYPKWRGTFFQRLTGIEALTRGVEATLEARTWNERQNATRQMLEELLRIQRTTELAAQASQATEPFFDRPFLRVETSIIPELMAPVVDQTVLSLPIGLGSIEQQSDNVAILTDVPRRRLIVGCPDSGKARPPYAKG